MFISPKFDILKNYMNLMILDSTFNNLTVCITFFSRSNLDNVKPKFDIQYSINSKVEITEIAQKTTRKEFFNHVCKHKIEKCIAF